MTMSGARFVDEQGPIEQYVFGRFVVAGSEHGDACGVGKDVRIIGTHVTRWVERRGHVLTPDMVTGVDGMGIEVLVIGNGAQGALRCTDDVVAAIASQGIADVRVDVTAEACKLYNELHREGRKVALLAHGTC